MMRVFFASVFLGFFVATASAQSGTALVRHASTLNGTVQGSIQQMLPESVTLNGGTLVTGDLLIPGLPTVQRNGNLTYAGTLDGTGAATPTNYQVTLNGGVSLRNVIRRTNAITLPTVSAPPSPTGTRTVLINSSGQSAGDFSTLRNLTLNGAVGQYAIPPGTYGDFTANGGSGFTLGVAGATIPAVYNFQHLTLNGSTQFQVVGPVVVTVAYGFTANGNTGSSAQPGWLTLKIYSGNFTLNGGSNLHGYLTASTSTVTINGNSQLIGGLISDRLIVNGNGLLKLSPATANNQPPTANPQSITTPEDTAKAIVLSASDPEGATLSYTVVTPPAHGSLNGTASNLTYTPAANYNGPDSFTFKVSDGQADSPIASVSLSVSAVNDAPVATPKTATTAEDTPLAVTLTGSDPEGSSLTFSVTTQPSHGVLTGSAPNVTYTPALNYAGPDSFTFTVSDGSLNSAPALVSLTVTAVNDAPVATPRSVSVQSGASVAIVLSGSDVENDPLTFATVTQPAHGSLTGSAPNFTYTPAAGFVGSDSFTFRAFDGAAYSPPVAVAITISPRPNSAPFAQAQSVSTNEDTEKIITLTGTDADGDALVFSILVSPAHGTLSLQPGTSSSFKYMPAEDYSGSDNFSFKVSDGTLDSAAAAVSISVAPVNDAPVANAQTLATDEDTSLPVTLTGSDVEASPLSYTIVTPPAHGTLEPRAGIVGGFTYKPAADYAGADSFTFNASDGALDSPTATVNLTIRPINDAPTAIAQSAVTTLEDTPIVIVLSGEDVDGDAITVSIETPPTRGVLTPQAGTPNAFLYTPEPNISGNDSFTFKASDAVLSSAPALVTLTVTPINDAPVATGQAITLPQDTANSLTLSATDVENDVLTYTIVSGPAHGSLSGTGANRIYTSAPGYEGSDSFTFKANDGALDSNVATITLTIVDINHAPVASGQSETLAEDTIKLLTLAATDADADPLVFTIVTPPAHGTLAPQPANPRQFTYTPAADYYGSDIFTFTVSDGSFVSAPAQVSLTITPLNDAPVAIPQALATDEDTSLEITLASTDVDSATLTYSVVSVPSHGVITPKPGLPNVFIYTPAMNYTGSDNLTFKANDGTLDSGVATVALTIRPINDAPVAISPAPITTAEDTSVEITLSGSDVDSSTLTYAIVALPAHGTLSPKPGTTSTFVYAPALNYHGADNFTFKLNDGSADSAPAAAAINITSVNDQPVATSATVTLMTGIPTPISLVGSDVETPAASLVFNIATPPSHGTLTPGPGTPNVFTYISAGDFSGFDSFTFTVNDGAATSVLATVQLTSGLPPRSRTYTTTADFNQGAMISVSTDVADQLSNKTVLAAYDVVWVTNSSKGTVAKLDPQTARVLGEYRTAPESVASPYPSRVAVDSKGNLWVANYSHNSIVKIGQPDNGFAIDRNGNGLIETSGALGEVKPWTGADSISSASDEGILLYVRTNVPAVRHISIDSADNVWVGGPGGDWQKFDGQTGTLLRTEPSIGLGAQGGFISPNGKLHSIGGDFLIWQTSAPIAALPASADIMKNAWGCALDSQGNLWVTRDWTSTIVKYSPTGEKLGEYYHGEPWAMGVAIDANDHVWVAHSHCGHSVGHLLPDGRLVGNVTVANHGPVEVSIDRHGRIWVASSTGVVESINPLGGPLGSDGVTPVGEVDLKSGNLGGALWIYGRFTGNSFGLSTPEGMWTNTYDGVLAGSSWGPVVWNGLIGNDAKLEVQAALSPDGVTFSAYQLLTPANPIPTGSGRFLKTRVRLVSATTGETPALFDLTVGTTGYTPPPNVRSWFVSAGTDIAGNWPDSIELKGAFMRSAHDFPISPTYGWSVVSAPAGGTVSFDSVVDLRTKALFSVKGTYVLRLTATLDGVVSTDDVKVVLTPYNRAPYANAGYTTFIASHPPQIWLWGEVRDDGLPVGAAVTSTWEKLFGPGTVSFTNAGAASTQASFSVPGVYTMRLKATDGELSSEDYTDVWIGLPAPPPPGEGLVSWWEASGNGDDHISGNQAFTEQGAGYIDGKVGGAFRFDGLNDRVRVFSSPSLDVGKRDGITVELWAKPSVERTATFFQYGTGASRGFQMRQINRTVEVSFREAGGTEHLITTGNILAVGTWTHLTASYNRATGEARIFANGILQAVQLIGSFELATDFDVYLGGKSNATEYYAGALDEISIYNRAIFADEVTTIVTAGKRPPVSNLPPVVNAGTDLIAQPVDTPIALSGVVTDDGQPINGVLASSWTKVAGPGAVTFANAAQPQTTVTFSAAGLYVLKLSADDGAFNALDTVEVRVASYGTIEPDSALAAWWPGNGTDVDVINGLKLERFHGMIYGQGQIEQGFAFDGVNDQGRVAAHSDLDVGASTLGMTVELWVKSSRTSIPNPTTDHQMMMAWGTSTTDGVRIATDRGRLNAYLKGTDGVERTLSAAGVFAQDVWTHVAVTYDKATGMGRLYRNGALLIEQNFGSFTPQTSLPLTFGVSLREGIPFIGALDEISLYTRPLTVGEIDAIYRAGSTGKNPVDDNQSPVVSAGPDRIVASGSVPALLAGTVSDDGLPAGGVLTRRWSKVDGPGAVSFANENVAATTATFTAAGIYVLKLDANDGFNASSDTMIVRVGLTGMVETDSSLAAWWPANGDPREVVKGNHSMELYNGAGYVSGQVSQGFAFDGLNDQGRVAAHSDLDVGASALGMTVELWVKSSRTSIPNPTTDHQMMMAWGTSTTDGVRIATDRGRLNAYLKGTDGVERTLSAVGVFAQDVWTHVAVTYDRATGIGRMYRNGALLIEQSFGSFTPQTSLPLTFGVSLREGIPFIGALDEISLYTRPLTVGEIDAIYRAGTTGKNPVDDNQSPVVSAGPDRIVASGSIPSTLAGAVSDDGLPAGGVLTSRWSKVDGPGAVSFANENVAATTATFTAAGIYVLKLDANDGFNASSDTMIVRVGLTGMVETDSSLAAWWPANGDPREVVKGNHTVELYNGAGYISGQVSQGFAFDGLNDQGRVAAHSDLDVGVSALGMTVELWVKSSRTSIPNPTMDHQMMMAWGTSTTDGVRIATDRGRLNAYLKGTDGVERTLSAVGVFVQDVWTHVAVTYDRATGIGRMYRNGALLIEQSFGSFTPQTSLPLTFGVSLREGIPFIGALDEISLYTRPLTASQILAIYQAGNQGKAPIFTNTAPVANAGADKSTFVGTAVALAGSSLDDGLPTTPGTQTYQWSIISGPGTVSFSAPTARSTTATFGALGSYTLRFSASDSALTGSDDVIVTVLPAPPAIALTAPGNNATLYTGTAVTLFSTATDADGTVAKVEFFDGATKLGETIAPLAGQPSTYSYVLSSGLPVGTHMLTAKATDDAGLSTTSAAVTVTSTTPPSQPPAISIYEPLANASIGVGVPFDISVTATDSDGTIAKVEFFKNAVKIGQQTQSELGHPTTYFWQLTSGLPAGTYTFTAKATDNSGATTLSAPITVGISDSPTTSNPLFIATPDDSARIAAPTEITGVVALPGLTSWSLQYRLRPIGDDTSTSSEPWVVAASGNAPVGTPATSGSAAIPGPLGNFDPTLLLNGLYELRLSATSGASTTRTSPLTLIVEGNMKVGAFTLAFEDLKLPVAGLPITITRTYDSRDVRVGDFGPGWHLAVANVRVQKNRHLGNAWYQTLQSGNGIQFYYVDPTSERIVTVTMPDGETHRFRAGAFVKIREGDPDNASFAVVVRRGKFRFYPLGDTASKLEPLNSSNQLTEDFWIEGTGNQDLRADDPTANPFAENFNTSRFRLTTKDGSVYILDEALGLLQLRDLNGNTLVLNRDGQNRVTSLVSTLGSAPVLSSSTITITRDAAGRVDYIRDSAGKYLDYIYDSAGRLSSFTNRELNVTQFRYENPAFSHYLTRIIDPRGISALRTEFDAAGKLIKQIDADGKETLFTRGVDGTGRFEKVKDRLGHESTFYYDARGNVTLKLDPLGGQTTFTYDANDNQLTMTDPLGHTSTTTYDAQKNLLSQSDALGHTTSFTYNALGLPLTITDARGKVTTNAYDAKGNLLTTTDPKGNITTFTYDAVGRLSQVKDALNHTTTHTYTAQGWIASTTNALGHVTAFTYDANGNRLTQTVTRTKADSTTVDETTTFAYDSESRLTKTTFPDGTFSGVAYNAFGKQSSVTDPLGRATSYAYDARGNLATTTFADGATESSAYDLENRVTATTDRAGRTTTTTYDSLGRATQVAFIDGTSTSTGYDAAGRVTTTTDALGHVTTFDYDAAGRRTSVKNALNETTAYVYDAAGNLTSFTDALNRTTDYGYDDGGLRTIITFPDNTTQLTTFDALGRKVAATDQAGKITRWRYDALGHLSEVRQYLDQTLAPGDADYHLPFGTAGVLITRYAHDERGNQISQADALGRVTRYAYDALGRRIQRTLPGGQVETYAYDPAGNLSTKTDFNGYATTYIYDSLNRLTEKHAAATHPSLTLAHAPAKYTYTYNALGQRVGAVVLNGPSFGAATLYSETTSYDLRNRPSARATSHGTLNYTYDAQGNLAALKSNDLTAGIDIAYTYDALNRLATVGTRDPLDGTRETTNYGYDAVGNLAAVALPNTVASLYGYDTLNRLKTLSTDRLGALFSSYTYTLNASGHRTSVTEINNRRHDYTYDALDRLTVETITAGSVDPAPVGAVTYTHDAVGNRLSRSVSGTLSTQLSTLSSSYDSNDRLTTDSYDANGNTLQGAIGASPVGSTTDTYDFENHLISRNNGTIKLVYDSEGHRVSETVGAQTITYLVDIQSPTGYAQVVEERVNGTLARTYAYGHNLISQTQAALSPLWTTSYYGYDGHGSTAFLTDATGAITDTYRYDAFGNLIHRTHVATQPTFNRYRYTGQQYDDDLGLYYLRARYMNPDSGRFWSQDGYEGKGNDPMSLHKYLYAHADPVRFIDLTGQYADLQSTQMTGFVISTTARTAIPSVTRYVVAAVAGTTLALISGDSRVSVEETRRRGKAIIGETASRVRAAKAMRYQDAEIFDWNDSTDDLITEVGALSGAGRLRVLEELNYAWIASVIARHLIIYDIGFDVDRFAGNAKNDGGVWRSENAIGIFYLAELEWTRGYPLKAFVKFPGSNNLLGL